MNQSYFESAKRNNSGFSLLETLIAASILCVVGLLVIPGFLKEFKVVKSVARGGSCDASLIHSFSQLDRYRVDPTQPHPFLQPLYREVNGLPDNQNFFEVPPSLKDRFERMKVAHGITRLYEPNPSAAIGPDVILQNGVTLYTPLLANDTMGLLADLSSLGYKDTFRNLPAPLIPPPLNAGETFQGQIQIQHFNLDNKLTFTPSKELWPRPRNQFERDKVYFPINSAGPHVITEFPDWINDDFGYQVTLRGQITNELGEVTGDCERTQSYSYPMDFHNVLDFSNDLTVVFRNNQGKLIDNTPNLSNKNELASSIPADLQPIFTNLGLNPQQDGRERRECSQQNQALSNFYLRLKIYNLRKEAGVLPLCLDTSLNWLSGETASGGWCSKNYVPNPNGGQSKVLINSNGKTMDGGWVPCERLSFCGQKPDRTDVVTRSDAGGEYIEYRYHYDIRADDNTAGNRLWGCELKYMVAAADTSGNVLYPPSDTVTDTSALTTPTVINANIREAHPRIYFKPPPCYACNCKPCKKGGFFRKYFNWIVLAVLVAATGGAYAAFTAIYTAAVAASLTVACALGGIHCEKPKSQPDNYSNMGDFASCQANPQTPCKCGTTCNKRRAPGPGWADSLNPQMDPDTLNKSINETACEATASYPVNADGVSFSAKLGYRKQSETSSDMVFDDTSPVLNGDTVAWQQFFPQTGKFCTVQYKCANKKWEAARESFETETGAISQGDLVGCFDVKVGHKIDWSSDPSNPSAVKPGLGDAQCLEVQFNKTPFASNSDRLYSSSQLQAECAPAKGPNGAPVFPIDLTKRMVGTVSNTCSSPLTLSDGSTVTYAANFPITTSDPFTGASYVQCYSQCTPPAALPQGPDSATPEKEQLYYENYSSSQQGLPFCNMDRSRFDAQ